MSAPSAAAFGAQGRAWGTANEHQIVLVHGLGVASRMMAPLARLLAADRKVIAPDLPGFGASADLPALDVPSYGHWLAEGIRRIGRPTTLVGCSLGTQFALHAAAALGDDLDGLVLASPTIDPDLRSPGHLLARWPLEAASQPRALRRIQLEDHRRAGPRRVINLLRDALRDRPEVQAPAVRCRSLVLRGTRDPLVRTEWARFLSIRLHDAECVILPARHAMTFTEPDTIASAIDVWQADVAGSSRTDPSPPLAGHIHDPNPR